MIQTVSTSTVRYRGGVPKPYLGESGLPRGTDKFMELRAAI